MRGRRNVEFLGPLRELEKFHAGDLTEHVSDIAHHLVQAGARERAATYLSQAGSQAAARLATPEALP